MRKWLDEEMKFPFLFSHKDCDSIDLTERKRPRDEVENESTSEATIDGISYTLSEQQSAVVEAVLSGRHVFFTGPAGVGKSLTLKVVVAKLRKKHGNGNVYVTASTGVAACNINGTTLHAFAGVGLGKGSVDTMLKRIHTNKDLQTRWRTAKVLVIDEISMIAPDFFEVLDVLARRVRRCEMRPFGGLQLVLAGDFLQLPYVPDQSSAPSTASMQTVDAPFLFETETWKRIFRGNFGIMIELKRVFRQRDVDFIDVLHAARLGRLQPAHVALLNTRLRAPIDCSDGIMPTRLYPYRATVQKENTDALSRIDAPIMTFRAEDTGSEKHLEFLDRNCQAPKVLSLKVGAQVLLLRNVDFTRGLVNGARGVVVDFVPSAEGGCKIVPAVRFGGKRGDNNDDDRNVYNVEAAVWKMEMGDEVLCSRKAIPLDLAYACSIHKAMGLTISKVETRLADVFDCGQAYTALSRVTALEGLSLIDFDPAKVVAHPRVVAFYDGLNNNT